MFPSFVILHSSVDVFTCAFINARRSFEVVRWHIPVNDFRSVRHVIINQLIPTQ